MLSIPRWLRSAAITFAAVGGLAATLAGTPAQAANWLQINFGLSGANFSGDVPACEAGLGVIASRFAEKEGRFWNSALQIVGFESVREISFRPGHYATIPRRFCEGRVLINDGSRRPIYYGIGEDTGILGLTWGVEWCVVGLDRNWAYNPACKAARP